jgi:hypothetical protein
MNRRPPGQRHLPWSEFAAIEMFSLIALNRIVEDKAAKDPKYRRELERIGKPLLSHARRLTDAELLGKLRAVGIELGKAGGAHFTRCGDCQ